MNTAKLLATSTLGTQPDTYFYALATSPHQSAAKLATIGSDDTLRLSDPVTLRLEASVPSCHNGVSCLIASSALHDGFITSGRDGLIKLWDPRTLKSALSWSDQSQRGFSAITSRDGTYLAAGTESVKEGLGEVSVLVYDVRKTGDPVRNYAESHTDSVTQLAFHATQSELLLSASTDGLVSFFDINQSEEEDALQQVLNPRSAVHCSGFLSTDEAYVLTTDEHFMIYPLNETTDGTSDPTMDFGDVRSQLDCMYVIDVLQQPNSRSFIAYGHNEAQTLSLVSLEGLSRAWTFGSKIDFPSAHGTEVVRDILITPDDQKAYTCGEDGNVRVWALPSADNSPEGQMQIDTPKASRKRRDKKSDRYAPY